MTKNPYSYDNIFWLDLETFSDINLKQVGSYRYAERSEILLWAWALNDGPVSVWDVTADKNVPGNLRESLGIADTIGWHNGNLFDRRVILNSPYAGIIKGKRYFDTMVQAYQHALPGGLKLLGKIFDLSENEAKDRRGRTLVRLFCVPQAKNKKIQRATARTHPAEWKEFIEYSRQDVIAMRKLHKLMPKWNLTAFEAEVQNFDLRMNDRGFTVDIDLCKKAIKILEREKKVRDRRTDDLTDGDVSAATQRDKLLTHILNAYGITLSDMQKNTLQRFLLDETLPDTVKELVSLRLESAATNTKKFQVFLEMVCNDGRVHGTIQHRGAFRTGRGAARHVQPQNMIRPCLEWPDIEEGIEAIKGEWYDLVRS